jgi:uncharacterized Tic20 family protein
VLGSGYPPPGYPQSPAYGGYPGGPVLGQSMPGGYGPAPGGYPPPGLGPQRRSAKTAMWAHLSVLLTWASVILFIVTPLFAFIPPLVIRNTGKGDPYVQEQASEALNCALTDLIELLAAIGIICVVAVAGMGPPTGPIVIIVVVIAELALSIARIVCAIIGCVRANKGEPFRYPRWVAFRFVKP